MMMKQLLIATGVLAAGPVYAGGEIFNSGSSCTTANCATTILNATIKSFPPSAGKWIAEVFAGAGRCLRIDVFSEFTDLQTVVVAPNGAVFRNDNRAGAADRRPLVKIASTPNNGWYTVSIGQSAGAAVSGNFSLAYGNYNAGNPNCSSPTPVFTPETAAPSKPSVETQPPAAGAPGAP
jgi:hypothetical protein